MSKSERRWRWVVLLLSTPVSACFGMLVVGLAFSLVGGCLRYGVQQCMEDAAMWNFYGLMLFSIPLGVIAFSPLAYWLLLVRQPAPRKVSERERKFMELP